MDTVTFTNADVEWLIHMRDNPTDFKTMLSEHGEEVVAKIVSTNLLSVFSPVFPKTTQERNEQLTNIIAHIKSHYLKAPT